MWEKDAKLKLDEAYFHQVREKEKFKTIVEMTGDIVFEYDIARDRMEYLNPEAGAWFPEVISDGYTQKITEDGIIESKEDARRFSELLRSGEERFEIELRRIGRDKQFHWVHVSGKTIYDRSGKPVRVLGKICNIDEQKEKNELLLEQSRKDSLTGFLNHMTVIEVIQEKLGQRSKDRPAYLIICDIDNLKEINDKNGHWFGDAVICSLVDAVNAIFPTAVKGRIGGDEFLLYTEDVSRERLEEQLTALNRFRAGRYNDDKTEKGISCSIGVAVIGEDAPEFDVLFQWADSALYEVKNGGKGYFLFMDAQKGVKAPPPNYIAKKREETDYVCNNALIGSGEELILFCLDIMDNVPTMTGALKMISECVCRFYDLDDVIYIEHEEPEKEILYAWSRVEKQRYADRMYKEGVYEWDLLCKKADERGVILYGEEQTKQIETEEAVSAMIILSREMKGYRSSIVFCDRNKDRTWDNEREILTRIAYDVFKRLKKMKREEKERSEIERKLNYDSLTGLPVYHKFIASAEVYLRENGKEKAYFVYSDFASFQYLNETYGYEAGDEVLREFGNYLQKDCPGGILFCRISSDHFASLLSGESAEQVRETYRNFTAVFADKCNEKYNLCSLAVCSGIYKVAEKDKSVSAMLDNAQKALKHCQKQNFFTEAVIFSEAIRSEFEKSKEIMANVVNACKNRELQAYLQPKVSLKTGKIVGAEALVRWIRPDGRMIMPSEFIEICEKNGYITKIDFYVLERVMEYLQEAIASGEEVVPISVNFSRRHAEMEGFVNDILRYLKNYCVTGSLLEMEVTESLFSLDIRQVNEQVVKLQERGIEISVDDFGAGYSSFGILTKLNADTIKLDRQFVVGMEEESKSFTVVNSLIKMLKMLDFKVIAEGVETREQVEMLKKADCDGVQGYYYAKPMPIQEFRRFLREFNGEIRSKETV